MTKPMTTNKIKTTNKTPIIELSRAFFVPVAISFVILAGCSDANLEAENEDGAQPPSPTTDHPCHEPSAGNLLKNPGFDADVSSWSSAPGASLSLAKGNDALTCPHSGSAAGLAEPDARVYQCVPIASATKYDFGLMASGAVYCDVDTFTEANCAGQDNGLRTQSLWINLAWSPDLGSNGVPGDHAMLSFTTAATDKSALVSCYSYFDDQDPAQPFYLDMMYLTPSPGGY
jgi:hypothetical protein